jgi:hypothetical protein
MRHFLVRSSVATRALSLAVTGALLIATGAVGASPATASPGVFAAAKKKVVKKKAVKKAVTKPTRRPVVTVPTIPATVPPTVAPPPPPPTQPPTTLAPIPPVFELRADTTTATATSGRTMQYGISVVRPTGFAGAVVFNATGVPAGTTASFAPNPTSASTVLYVTPSATTPDGTYTIGVTGTAGATVKTTSITLVVSNPPAFSLTVPASINAPTGSTTNTAIGFSSSGSSVPTVSLAIAGLPSGVTAAFVPNPTFGPTTLVVTVAAGTTAGTYPLTITGTSGGLTLTYATSLVVSVGGTYSLAASPNALAIARGASATSLITVVASGGFANPISLVVTGIPAPATTSLAAGVNAATLTVAIPSNMPVGVYPVTITGTSGPLTSSVVVSVTVT